MFRAYTKGATSSDEMKKKNDKRMRKLCRTGRKPKIFQSVSCLFERILKRLGGFVQGIGLSKVTRFLLGTAPPPTRNIRERISCDFLLTHHCHLVPLSLINLATVTT
jgi:hypothetical protein